MVENFMEVVVDNFLDTVIGRLGFCNCQICKDDIANITLNNLTPQYRSGSKGELYFKIANLDTQFEIEILSQITKSAMIVHANPRH
jgi:competence protein ComFB